MSLEILKSSNEDNAGKVSSSWFSVIGNYPKKSNIMHVNMFTGLGSNENFWSNQVHGN